ncbi:uncharacterized protein AMSG_12339 [Thecamonas trahens ATCC 50062]|uniref:PCI domain-containing protein n=1 Tax=Thecamonas trahens ATCC 50062 TaxID=461836 RepID=A0A0L0DPV9_THETB|nr:hypothetical protein AMSG_12339 [Thecamonas trahens ATCC 50062]KNC54300.1 hypothetical protein AMSG_12339 [Thecamonas trahens ATCC 50062]|eukprot:XP_013753822.1 hypothetical protein AMSG_12339 [Thecamonas trahens ATCC 50062]
MMLFIKLCVEQRRAAEMKDGLHQYKTLTQYVKLASLDRVMKYLLSYTEEKVVEAQAKLAEALTSDSGEFLPEDPLEKQLVISSGDSLSKRLERVIVKPWLRFEYDAYRAILDILRNKITMEVMYHNLARMAFDFCKRYELKSDFRRFCDTLHSHLKSIVQYQEDNKNSPNAVKLNAEDGESLRLHMETRFVQLSTAMELGSWQKAFETVEELYRLMEMSPRPIAPQMMAAYYERVALLCWHADYKVMHTYAALKVFTLYQKHNRSMTQETVARMASSLLVGALSIPLSENSRTQAIVTTLEGSSDKSVRLGQLLHTSSLPTRDQLVAEIIERGIVELAAPELAELYPALVADFEPLSKFERLEPILAYVRAQPHLANYAVGLEEVAFMLLLEELAQVYSVVQLSTLTKLAITLDAARLEDLACESVRLGRVSLTINHVEQTLTFKSGFMHDTTLASHLVDLASSLSKASKMIAPREQERAELAQRVATVAAASVRNEHRMLLKRKAEIQARQEKEEAERKAAREARERAAAEEKERIARETAERLEADKLERERKKEEKVKAERERKRLEELKAEMEAKGVEIDDDGEVIDRKTLLDKYVTQISKEKNTMAERTESLFRRMDHLERYRREVEGPLIQDAFEKQSVTNASLYNAAKDEYKAKHRAEHDSMLELKALRTDPMVVKLTDAFYTRVLAKRREAHADEYDRVEAFIAGETRKREREAKARAKRRAER